MNKEEHYNLHVDHKDYVNFDCGVKNCEHNHMHPQEAKFHLIGKSNVGLGEQRGETYTVKMFQAGEMQGIHIEKDGKTIISFNPFLDGGSIALDCFSSLILDVERYDEKKQKFVHDETITTSSYEVQTMKKDSEKLQKLREAKDILNEV